MAIIDESGISEFPLPKEQVFEAICQALPTVKGMKIDYADKLQGRIMVKSDMTLASWGENILIQLNTISDSLTKVTITSSPKVGGNNTLKMDMGKNKKNIESILLATSKILSPQNQNSSSENITHSKSYSSQYSNPLEQPEPAPSTWYNKKWLVVLLCILFFPVGLYALWKSSTIGKGWKIVITIIFAIIIIANIGGKNKSSSPTSTSTDTESQNTKLEMTQAQKDSVKQVEIKKQIKEREDNTITAHSLTSTYADNEVKADGNFKGKTFYVEGTVTNIKKDLMDEIYVTLEGNQMFSEVQCFFDDKNIASQLQKGMRVTFRGKCKGLMMNVLMENCVLVDNLVDIKKQNLKQK